jgi:hypothetical protein
MTGKLGLGMIVVTNESLYTLSIKRRGRLPLLGLLEMFMMRK